MQTSKIQDWKETAEYQELGDLQKAFDIWREHHYGTHYNIDIDEAINKFHEAYQGHYSSELEFGQELADEMIPSDAPKLLLDYFDYEQFTYDIFIGDYWYQDGYVFRYL